MGDEQDILFVSISQHFEKKVEAVTLRGEILPETLKQYSNLKDDSRFQDLTYEKTTKGKFISEQSLRNTGNIFEVLVYLLTFSSPLDETIVDTDEVTAQVLKFIEWHSPRAKYIETNKEVNWKYPVTIKLKYNSTEHFLIEKKFPFKPDSIDVLRERIEQFFKKHGAEVPKKENEKANDYLIIKWTEVTLADQRIYFFMNNETFVIPFQEASAHLQQIKQILFRRAPGGLKISLQQPYKILEPEIFANIIKYLQVNYHLSNGMLSIPKFQQELLKMHDIQQMLRLSLPKDFYFNHLSEQQTLDLPIIPVVELNNQMEEPSYIFTIKEKSLYKIIWENKLHGRATHVFSATAENYALTLQNVFDYIKADLLLKRRGVSNYVEQLKANGFYLGYIGRVNHTSFDSWCFNLQARLKH